MASRMLEFLVESRIVHTGKAVPRFDPVAESEESAAPAKSKTTKKQEGENREAITDAPVHWVDGYWPEHYLHHEASRKNREALSRSLTTRRSADRGYFYASLMLCQIVRYLENPALKAMHSKESRDLLSRAQQVLWGVRATLDSWALYNEGVEGYTFGVNVHSTFNSVVPLQDRLNSLLFDNSYFTSLLATYFKRETFSNRDWYSQFARVFLGLRGEDGAVRPVHIEGADELTDARRRFLPNLFALLILRKEKVADSPDDNPAKPVSGEAKPAPEKESPDEPKQPGEKPSEDKATKKE